MEFTDILFAKSKRIATIRLNRPEAMNAVRDHLWREMERAVEEVKSDDDVRVLVITGEGRAFSAGQDLKEAAMLAELRESNRLFDVREMILRMQRVTRELINMPKPVIAAVNGYALGAGAELAILCDMRVASEKAKFGFPEVRVGSFETNGVTFLLPRLVGLGRAKELMMTGRHIGADEALRIGLVERVVPHVKLMEESLALAGAVAEGAPVSVSLVKTCLNKGAHSDLETALTYETEAVMATVMTEDMIEGAVSFLEKRKPVFKGR
jgi:enoyl-CoA hydratase/carnithine racemase